MTSIDKLKVQIYADGADLKGILELYAKPYIKGLTTNPTLMKSAGVSNYEAFAKEVLKTVKDKPMSFEVFSDEWPEMRRQALKIRDWQSNVYVKIPICNTKGESALPLIKDLAAEGVKLNVTAILTVKQVEELAKVLQPKVPSVVSVFAGRIADTGVDPLPIMKKSRELLQPLPAAELLWASVREIYNIFEADEVGCHIVTVPHSILSKAQQMVGKDLTELSVDTVKMFYKDACAAGFSL